MGKDSTQSDCTIEEWVCEELLLKKQLQDVIQYTFDVFDMDTRKELFKMLLGHYTEELQREESGSEGRLAREKHRLIAQMERFSPEKVDTEEFNAGFRSFLGRGEGVRYREIDAFLRDRKVSGVRLVAPNYKGGRKCNNCSAVTGVKKCSRCNTVYYCNRECQKIDWILQHKSTCRAPEHAK